MKLIVALSALVLSASTALAGGYYGSTGVYYDDLDIYDPVPSVVGRVRAAASAGLSCAADSLCRWTSAGAVLWALWLWSSLRRWLLRGAAGLLWAGRFLRGAPRLLRATWLLRGAPGGLLVGACLTKVRNGDGPQRGLGTAAAIPWVQPA